MRIQPPVRASRWDVDVVNAPVNIVWKSVIAFPPLAARRAQGMDISTRDALWSDQVMFCLRFADEEDSSYAIAAILALGAISLFTFPLVGHWLHLTDRGYGLWAGLAVDNTAEASAAGALFSDAAGKVAVLAKTCRNAMIGFVVLGYALYWASKGQLRKWRTKSRFYGASSPNSFWDFC